MTFRLCLNTSTIKPQPLREKIRLVAEAGFDGIELWINDLYEYVGRGGEVSEVEQMLSDHGLFVPCMIALRQWGEAVGLEYKLMLEEAKRRMELVARIGAPYVVATPPRDPCDLGQIADRYVDLLEIGQELGVKPTFEYISFFQSAPRLDDAWAVLERIDHPDATIIVDAFHTWNSQSDATLLGRIPATAISHYHIDDASPHKPAGDQMDPDRVMLGDGPIDLANEIQMLKSIGYEGCISLELFNAELWAQPPAEVLATGLERLKSFVD